MNSSINSSYTFNYSQPSEYQLSHDSVFLAQKVFECLSVVDLENKQALDICAGCGVVGMDFLFHRRIRGLTVPGTFDFLEVQRTYLEHFYENVIRLGPIDSKLNFLNINYNELQNNQYAQRYDLIVCNPPYFQVNQGRLSPNQFKNRCRFYIDSDLKNLLFGIAVSLKQTGSCYILLRDLHQHGWNTITEAKKISKGRLQIEIIEEVRRAYILRLQHLKI